MPLDFPNDPVVGDIFAGAGARWLWDGAKWTSLMTSGGPFLPLTGGALTGPLMLAADPAVALHAATKQYVDGHAGISGYLPLTGGELSGPLMLAAMSTVIPPAGVGLLQGHAVNGTVVQGSGSATDFMLNNKNGTAVMSVPAAGTTVNLSGGKISSTVGLGLGSSVLLHVGDAVAANNNPVLMSYKVGAASGALASLGFNNYINALGAGGIRINGAKNGWSIQHDTRTASDGDLGLSVTSSGGVITAPYTFGATGVLTVGNVATTSAVSAPRYQANRTLALTAANDQIANLAVNLSGAYTGSAGNIVSPFVFNIATDTVDAGSPGVVRGVYIQHLFGGSTVKGMREGHHVHLNMTAQTANNGLGIFYVGQNITVNGLDNDNGTAVTPSSNLFGFNYIITLGPAATYWNSLIGGEIDIVAKVGSSVVYKCGLQIVNWALDGVQGTLQDTYISLNRHSAATTAMRLGIEFGSPGGWWPIDPAGTMLGTNALFAGSPARLAAFGIDFSQVTFSVAFLKSAGFLVDGSGNLTARAGVYGATVALNGNSGLVFQAGDTVTANSIPLTYSYIVGATSGAIANVGLNAYLNTSGVVARVNAAKNGWLLSQDTRATNDAPLLVRVQSSAGAAATVATFDTAGGLTMAAGVTATAAIFTSLRVNGNAGFNSTAPIAKPTVSGAKASNAALASLITALANYGLITDTTTA